MRKLSLIVFFLVVGTSLADATLKLPDTVKGDPGDFIKVPATTDGKQVRWVAMDKGLNVFPVELLKDSKTAIVIAKSAGSYRLLAYTAAADVPSDPAICVIIVGDVPPTPPIPPTPIPPTPPNPSDPFTQSVLTAYNAEMDAAKSSQLLQLAALYHVAATSTVNDSTLATTADLLARLQAARKAILPDTALTKVRDAIRIELNKTLSNSVPLDAATRATVSATLSRVAATLDSVTTPKTIGSK